MIINELTHLWISWYCHYVYYYIYIYMYGPLWIYNDLHGIVTIYIYINNLIKALEILDLNSTLLVCYMCMYVFYAQEDVSIFLGIFLSLIQLSIEVFAGHLTMDMVRHDCTKTMC